MDRAWVLRTGEEPAPVREGSDRMTWRRFSGGDRGRFRNRVSDARPPARSLAFRGRNGIPFWTGTRSGCWQERSDRGRSRAASVLKTLWSSAEACTPHARVPHSTPAIMDLGATLSTRAQPACTVCPLIEVCVAAREGRQADLPGIKQRRERPSREAVLLIAEPAKRVRSRSLSSVAPRRHLGRPLVPAAILNEADALAWCRRELGHFGTCNPAADRHGFTHFDLRLQPLRVRSHPSASARGGGSDLYALRSPPKIGLPRPIHQLFERMRTLER